MSRVVYPARETVTEIRGEDAAEIINKMMEKEGMTQIQLAQKMGITRQRVCRLISGNMRYEFCENRKSCWLRCENRKTQLRK